MKRYVIGVVLIAVCPLAWWIESATWRECERLANFAAGIPNGPIVFVETPPEQRKVISDLPGNDELRPMASDPSKLEPVDPVRRKAHYDSEFYWEVGHWSQRVKWAAPVVGLLFCWAVRKRGA